MEGRLACAVRKWGVEGVNENCEHLVDVCAERRLFLANTFFQHKIIHLYTWRRREDGGEEKSLIDYTAMDKRLRKDVLDAKVVRGALEGSDHYALVVKIMLRDKWEFCRKNGKETRRNDYCFRVRDPSVCAQRITEVIVSAKVFIPHTFSTPNAKKILVPSCLFSRYQR